MITPSPRTFIVEDSPHVLAVLRSMIQDIEGMEIVGEADEAKTAILGIRQTDPDVVILDIQLKSGTGLDVLREIRFSQPGRPIIMIFSSSTEPGLRKAWLELGANHVFHKPQEYKLLANTLRALLP